MARYLAELYLARSGSGDLDATVTRARAAARALTAGGTPVRYLRSIFVPEDETWFLLYDAPTPEAVAEVNARAGISVDRIVEAILPS